MTTVNFSPTKVQSDLEDVLKRCSELTDGRNKEAANIIRELSVISVNVLKNKLMCIDKNEKKNQLSKDDERILLRKKYNEVKGLLYKFLHWKHKNVQELSLITLMKLVKTQAEFPFYPVEDGTNFPIQFFQDIINELMKKENDMISLMNRFKEFTEFDDVTFHLLKSLNLIIKQNKNKTQENPNFTHNFFYLLEQVKLKTSNDEKAEDENDIEPEIEPEIESESESQMESDFENEIESIKIFCKPLNDDENPFKIDYEVAKKLFNATWMEFLKLQITPSIYKRILIILHDQVFPHLQNPLLLTDFLIESYNTGGVVSLLSLTSLFFLIQNYNLEYPDFYKKFYSLFTPDIFQAKYKARFFYLADLFLSSTHLPEYVLAAFVKKMSRLALTSPPNIILIIIPFIKNILIRYKNLEKLVHNSSEIELDSDPFLMDETDPFKCRATDSSLWELKTLQSHYVPDVAISAKMVNRILPPMESNLSDKYENSISDIFDKVNEANWEEVAVSFEKPEGLIKKSDNKIQYFCL